MPLPLRLTVKQKTRLGAWHFIPATGELRWSDEAFHIHQIEPGHQPRPEESINFYLPEYRPIITEAFRRACREGVSYDLTLEIETPKGHRRWVRTIGWPVMRDGRVVKLSGAFQDVTEARFGQEALRERRSHPQPDEPVDKAGPA